MKKYKIFSSIDSFINDESPIEICYNLTKKEINEIEKDGSIVVYSTEFIISDAERLKKRK